MANEKKWKVTVTDMYENRTIKATMLPSSVKALDWLINTFELDFSVDVLEVDEFEDLGF